MTVIFDSNRVLKEVAAGFCVAVIVFALGVHLVTTDLFRLGFPFFPIICFVSAMLMPTAYLLVGFAGSFAIVGLGSWIQHWYVTSAPTYGGSPGEAIGLLFVFYTFLAVGGGTLLNVILRFSWRWWRTGR